MNILIIGANGQLGNCIQSLSGGYAHKFIFTDVIGGGNVLALDACSGEEVRRYMRDYGIDVIVNCAAYTDVNKAEEDEELAYKINAQLPFVLASAAKEYGASLIHISTDYVFDGSANTPYRESAATNPQGGYARTKLAGEELIMESGCRYIILRTAWLYSVYGKNFFKTIEAKAAESDSLTVVVDQLGTPTYAADLAQAVLKIIDDRKLDDTGIYHYTNEGVASWYDFAAAINRGYGYPCVVKPIMSSEFPSKVHRPAYSVLDKSKFKLTFCQNIPHWEDALNRCIREYSVKKSE